ncbi:MAG: putative porin [Rikenellaceae bacterium]
MCVIFGSDLLIASPVPVYYEGAVAQEPRERDGEDGERERGGGMPADSADKAKVRKPLESYLFDDSLRSRVNFSWYMDMDNNDIILEDIDTSLYRFQVTYPYIRTGVGSAYLGNLGGASVPLNYFDRPQYTNFSFAQAFDTYLKNTERVQYFNTKKPFTHLSYFTAGSSRKEESSFNAKHEQNISPSTGIGLDYTSLGTKGTYSSQKARDKSLTLSLAHTGKKYTVHGGYIYNSVTLRENGGVVRSTDITDTIYEMPENIEVNLTDAQNTIKNNTYYLIQSYGIPLRRLSDADFTISDRSSLYVGHSFEYSRYAKRYTDTKENSGDFYEDWYINPEYSNDSIFESLHTQRLFVQIQPWDRDGIIGLINAGVGYDAHRYYMFGMERYLNTTKGVSKQTSYFYGSVQGKFKRYFDWKANVRYDAIGYRNGDMNLSAEASAMLYVKELPITLSASIENDYRTADYWVENYFSNHYVWQNSFEKENETRMDVTLKVPQIRLEAGAYQSVTTDKIYFGADALPAQAEGSVSVSGLYANKEVRIGGLHLNHRVLLQWSSNEQVVPVPLASAFVSYNYNFMAVKDVLSMQIGIDGKYNTKYYAFGYNPATAQFYNQREEMLGNYLMLDAYVSCKWKRMRILAKIQHFNENLFGFSRNYFTVLNYPDNVRMVKLGISWTFYD